MSNISFKAVSKENLSISESKLEYHTRETYPYFRLKNQNATRDVEENWQFIHCQILKLINDHVPTKLLHSRSHYPWLSTPLKQLIREKQHVYNHAKYYNDEST